MGTYGEKFVKEFFKRTLYNLRKYDELHDNNADEYPYNVTHLVNSFLGLIIFVKEDEINLGNEIYDSIKDKVKVWSDEYDREKNSNSFIRHIRNAVAHKKIREHVDEDNNIIAFTFIDHYNTSKFEIRLSVNDLRKLIDLLNNKISGEEK